MLNTRLFRFLAMSILIVICLSGIVGNLAPVWAQTPEPSPTSASRLTLETRFPALSADVGYTFSYDVDIKYYGTDRQTFNLVATAPEGWSATVTGAGAKQISQVQVTGYDNDTPGIEGINITFTPSYSQLPGPGVYSGNIKVTNGTLTEIMQLRATVISKYNFALDWTDPTTGTPTTDVTMRGDPGKASTFPFDVTNAGSAEVKGLTFSAVAPKGWNVTFSPASITSLGSNQTQQVNAEVTPPDGPNMAGDYVLTLKGDNGAVSNKMTLRINIPVSTTSVWVIVGVTAAVIVALVAIYQLTGKKKGKTAK